MIDAVGWAVVWAIDNPGIVIGAMVVVLLAILGALFITLMDVLFD